LMPALSMRPRAMRMCSGWTPCLKRSGKNFAVALARCHCGFYA
jgi:hypothetical protein